MPKNNVFISLLKEHTNIYSEFINIFFKNFKLGGELNFDIEDTSVAKYLGISLLPISNTYGPKFNKNN